MIGVDGWAIELQKAVFSLYQLLIKLNKELLEITKELMDEERITLEIGKLPWYIELEGKKNLWNLRLVFESQEETRSFEMYCDTNSTKFILWNKKCGNQWIKNK